MIELDNVGGTREASLLWGLTQATIKNYCREGKVRAKQIGREWVIDLTQPSPAQPHHPKNWRSKGRP